MKFKPGDMVVATKRDRFGNSEHKTGTILSRNLWTCTVKLFNNWHESYTESFYEHQLEYAHSYTLTESNIAAEKPTLKQKDQWDESLRGKKMSNNYGKVIYKYQMPIQESFTMTLPEGAQILRVADQEGMFWMWAVVDTRLPDEVRQFVAVKCGANVPDDKVLNYIGMCAIFVQQELALYIFEDITDYERSHI